MACRSITSVFLATFGLLVLLAPEAPAWTMKQAVIMTPWADEIDPAAPLPEYPRPQMVRQEWLNLNGIWQWRSGTAGEPAPIGQQLPGEILVPFCVESAISGVKEHHERLWYRRTFEVPTAWAGKRILLHFDAVDWEAEVFLNGQSLGIHKGGYDQFSYDITDRLVAPGPQELILRVYDPTNSDSIAVGKQSLTVYDIWFEPVTGIWQTVWL
ncbi:MAG: hypothetical protein JXB13_19115, partial [Phycisphaerae bacterium]|nr:hypothetical protein [Phycisphaerae bacterium]